MTATGKSDVDVATRGAERFLRVYYNAYDSKDRAQNLPKFYLPTATAVWNGNPLQGADGVKKFIEKMPNSKHSIISFDCQAIPSIKPLTLIVTVSGTVLHGKNAAVQHPRKSGYMNDQPRVFAQTFVLTQSEGSPVNPATNSPPKYYISSDEMRFVG